MNVLGADRTPRVMGLREVLRPGSTTGSRCWSAARSIAWRRSSIGWRFSKA